MLSLLGASHFITKGRFFKVNFSENTIKILYAHLLKYEEKVILTRPRAFMANKRAVVGRVISTLYPYRL